LDCADFSDLEKKVKKKNKKEPKILNIPSIIVTLNALILINNHNQNTFLKNKIRFTFDLPRKKKMKLLIKKNKKKLKQ
jgi:hypothetical protein